MCYESPEPHTQDGGVAEWSNAVVLKTTVPQGTVGSNPTPSVFNKKAPSAAGAFLLNCGIGFERSRLEVPRLRDEEICQSNATQIIPPPPFSKGQPTQHSGWAGLSNFGVGFEPWSTRSPAPAGRRGRRNEVQRTIPPPPPSKGRPCAAGSAF